MKKYTELKFWKNNWQFAVLLLILIFGFYLRSYHLGYPSIGYHNMKENEFIGEAHVMLESGDFLQTKVLWKGLSENANIQEALPILPWYAAATFALFGNNLAILRMFIVACSLISVIMVYLIGMQLSNKNYYALLAAFIFSFLPLGVFFGRNYQPDMPALMFGLLFIYFFIKWTEDRSRTDLILFSSSIAMAGLLKITNLIFILAVVFLVPYKDLFKNYKKYLPAALIFILIMGSIPVWAMVSMAVNPTEYGVFQSSSAGYFDIFTGEYWQSNGQVIKAYLVGENFTAWYVWFSVLGLVFALLKRKTRLSKFVLGYVLTIIPYGMILSVRITQHNYYQMPFVALIAFLSAYFIFGLGTIASQIASNFTKVKLLKSSAAFIPLLLIVPTIAAIETSIDRQYDTLFIGYDVAGQYIREHSQPDERIVLEGKSAGQGASLFSAAARFGGWMPRNVTALIQAEDEKNARWIVLYNEIWRTGRDEGIFAVSQKQDIWQHIQDEYQIRQVGFLGSGEQIVRIYMVLEKTGLMNESVISNNPTKAMTYELTTTTIDLYTVE